ncbi:mCG146052, partial [Mus musculus]
PLSHGLTRGDGSRGPATLGGSLPPASTCRDSPDAAGAAIFSRAAVGQTQMKRDYWRQSARARQRDRSAFWEMYASGARECGAWGWNAETRCSACWMRSMVFMWVLNNWSGVTPKAAACLSVGCGLLAGLPCLASVEEDALSPAKT